MCGIVITPYQWQVYLTWQLWIPIHLRCCCWVLFNHYWTTKKLTENVCVKESQHGSYLHAINDRESGNSSIIRRSNYSIVFLFGASFSPPAHLMMADWSEGFWSLNGSTETLYEKKCCALGHFPAIPDFSGRGLSKLACCLSTSVPYQSKLCFKLH